jgi:hypothetical protein
MYIGLRVKYPLYSSDFNETWILMTDFRKLLKYKISWKSLQWQPISMLADKRTDRQTDMMKLIVAFRNFANAPQNSVDLLRIGQDFSCLLQDCVLVGHDKLLLCHILIIKILLYRGLTSLITKQFYTILIYLHSTRIVCWSDKAGGLQLKYLVCSLDSGADYIDWGLCGFPQFPLTIYGILIWKKDRSARDQPLIFPWKS